MRIKRETERNQIARLRSELNSLLQDLTNLRVRIDHCYTTAFPSVYQQIDNVRADIRSGVLHQEEGNKK